MLIERLKLKSIGVIVIQHFDAMATGRRQEEATAAGWSREEVKRRETRLLHAEYSDKWGFILDHGRFYTTLSCWQPNSCSVYQYGPSCRYQVTYIAFNMITFDCTGRKIAKSGSCKQMLWSLRRQTKFCWFFCEVEAQFVRNDLRPREAAAVSRQWHALDPTCMSWFLWRHNLAVTQLTVCTEPTRRQTIHGDLVDFADGTCSVNREQNSNTGMYLLS